MPMRSKTPSAMRRYPSGKCIVAKAFAMPYPIDTDVEFVAKIAHKIRQPLSAMQSALQLLKKCEDSRIREQAYRAIERQIEHMTRLLDDLIAAAARGRPTLQVHRSRFDLREVVDEAIDT